MANDINIGRPGAIGGTSARPGGTQATGTDRKAGAVTPVDADRVSVSPESARLRAMEEQLLAVPDVDTAKVAELKLAIAEGRFEIDPAQVAARVLAFDRHNH